MPTWTLDTPPNWFPTAVATEKGWENPTTGEVLVAIRGLHTKGAAANIVSLAWNQTSYEEGDPISVTVQFSENVDVTAGATIVVAFDGAAGNITLYAAAQTDTHTVVFDKESDNTTPATLAETTPSTGTLTLAANVTADDTVTIDETVYTFVAELTTDPATVPYEVLIGVSASETIDNLIAAINGDAEEEGVLYSEGTVAHPLVVAAVGAGDTMDVTCALGLALDTLSDLTDGDSDWEAATLENGVANTGTLSVAAQTVGGTITDDASAVAATQILTMTGNALDTETVTIGSRTYTFQEELTDVDGNVLIGDTVSRTISNLVRAINLGEGADVDYADSMTVHAAVSAEQLSATEMKVTAKAAGTGGNALASTDTLTNGSFAATTLEGGAAQVTSTKTISAGVAAAVGTRTVSLAV